MPTSSPETRSSIARSTALEGAALFTGGRARVVLSPGVRGAGWLWAVGRGPLAPMLGEQHAPLPRRSRLRHPDGGEAQLVEHVLAALVLLDIDDITLRFEHGEAPVLDGSAMPFVRALRHAGVRRVAATQRPGGDSLVVQSGWRGRTVRWLVGDATNQLAPARTFIRASAARAARRHGAFPGARPGCAVLLDDAGHSALYGGRPPVADEAARHKLLDILGDLGPWRARGRLAGILIATEPSHATNPATIRAALASGALRYCGV